MTAPHEPDAGRTAALTTSLHELTTPEATALSVRGLFRLNKWRILLTYALFNLENLLRLAQPLVLGWAINDLLLGSYRGLWWFIGQHLAHLAIGTFRQMYDTRAFTAIYTGLATQLVSEQRANGVEVSRVAARSAMSRNYVEFFEQHVPMVIRAMYSIIGAMVMLAIYDPMLVLYCLGLVLPAFWINVYYSRKTLALSGRLHDEFEREVEVIEQGGTEPVREHYHAVAGWRIRLSDAEAVNFSLMEFFILGVLVLSLVHFCTGETPPPAGDIFAVFRYLLMFIMGLDTVPRLVQQLSRLKDIGRRMTGSKRK
jgi:ABC-type multidrug transport system fused ATPase/permease subunit